MKFDVTEPVKGDVVDTAVLLVDNSSSDCGNPAFVPGGISLQLFDDSGALVAYIQDSSTYGATAICDNGDTLASIVHRGEQATLRFRSLHKLDDVIDIDIPQDGKPIRSLQFDGCIDDGRAVVRSALNIWLIDRSGSIDVFPLGTTKAELSTKTVRCLLAG